MKIYPHLIYTDKFDFYPYELYTLSYFLQTKVMFYKILTLFSSYDPAKTVLCKVRWLLSCHSTNFE